MKTFSQFLTEARMAPLFHGTSEDDAELIIRHNMINGMTTHSDPSLASKRGQTISGVSLSRVFGTSKRFGSVIFELDQERLAHTKRIRPINYHALQSTGASFEIASARVARSGKSHMKPEHEEFVEGSIKDLNKYVKAVWVDDRHGDEDIDAVRRIVIKNWGRKIHVRGWSDRR